jgi:hypothetical protein
VTGDGEAGPVRVLALRLAGRIEVDTERAHLDSPDSPQAGRQPTEYGRVRALGAGHGREEGELVTRYP